MQEKKPLNANLILSKIKYLLAIRTDIQLAELLNIKPNTLSTWKQRNSIDFKLIIEFAQHKNFDLNEIFHENDSMKGDIPLMNYTPIIVTENIQQYINKDLKKKLKELPHYNFILGKSSRNIAFQIQTNRLAPLIPEGAFAICDFTLFDEVIDENYYVLISEKFGLLISRIKKINESGLELLDIQTTGKLKNYLIKKEHISEVWEIIGISTYKPIEASS